MNEDEQAGPSIEDQAAVAGQLSPRRMILLPMLGNILVDTAVPLACYHLSKAYLSPSDFTALIAASVFPMLKSLFGVIQRRSLDPIAIVILLGLGVSLVAISLGGSAKLLLLRESLFTGAFGVVCLISLLFPRPLMFYFGRYFATANNPELAARFNDSWRFPQVRRGNRVLTAVWGFVFLFEVSLRVVLIYTVSVATVLAVSPFIFGGITVLLILWTVRYGRGLRQRAIALREAEQTQDA